MSTFWNLLTSMSFSVGNECNEVGKITFGSSDAEVVEVLGLPHQIREVWVHYPQLYSESERKKPLG